MNIKFQLITALLASSVLFTSCGGDSNESSETGSTPESSAGVETEAAEEEPEAVIADYTLQAENSSATWHRTLDQKPTKQTTKLFGADVEIELGAVKMDMNGNAEFTEGSLQTTDGAITGLNLTFDMASFKLAKEAKQGLFDVVNYPNGTIEVKELSQVDGGYAGTAVVSLQGATAEYPIDLASTEAQDGSRDVNGKFTLQTIDFPLRTKVTKKDINKDEVAVEFTGYFSQVSE